MSEGLNLRLRYRRQRLIQDKDGRNAWHASADERRLAASKTAIIVCDMWDNHWSRGAAERVDEMAPRFNQVLDAARGKGVQIVHAPSETLGFYVGTPARERLQRVPGVEPPPSAEIPDPPLPIDDSDHGSDTGEAEPYEAWRRQHPAIQIDHSRDGISDDGREIYSYLQALAVEYVLIAGVHTNMCILNRSFGIKQMVKWGVDVALIRDLTDAMYNPAMPPYVSHADGTRLVIEYIEKFWCPTVSSEDLVTRA